MKLVITYDEIIEFQANRSYSLYTPLGLSDSVLLDNTINAMIPPSVMYNCNTVLVEIRPDLYRVIKSRYGHSGGTVDLINNKFLEHLRTRRYLRFKSAGVDLQYRYEIANCNYILKADIVSEKIEFLNYSGTVVPFDEFLSRADPRASKPFVFDLDFYRS